MLIVVEEEYEIVALLVYHEKNRMLHKQAIHIHE